MITNRIEWPDNFTNDLVNDINTLGLVERLYKGQKIQQKTGSGNPLFFVIEGGVKYKYLTKSGKPVITKIALPGDVFCTTPCDFNQELICLKKTSLFVLPYSAINHLTSIYPQFWNYFMGIVQRELANSTQQIILARLSADQKLAYFLLTLSNYQKRQKKSWNRFKLPVNRAEIAGYLHLSTETISRTFSKFHSDNILSISGKELHIISTDALSQIVSATDISLG